MKLHVGCGPHYIEGMFNIDLRNDCRTDYCGNMFDLVSTSHPMHIQPGSVGFIWSCHMLEHLSYPKGVCAALKTFYDWLQPCGVLRLSTPDLRKVAEYYISDNPKLFSMYGDSIDERIHKQQSRAEIFTFFMRGWDHTVVFDFDLIRELLEDAGFKDIKQMPFGKSRLGHWQHDRMPEESMYVEGIK
jgi:predicted SAM-dependent methyltransferase